MSIKHDISVARSLIDGQVYLFVSILTYFFNSPHPLACSVSEGIDFVVENKLGYDAINMT